VIAANIHKRWKAIGSSQEELAGLYGLHQTYAGAIGRGEGNVTVNPLAETAMTLK